jgi:hypothetical protein
MISSDIKNQYERSNEGRTVSKKRAGFLNVYSSLLTPALRGLNLLQTIPTQRFHSNEVPAHRRYNLNQLVS